MEAGHLREAARALRRLPATRRSCRPATRETLGHLQGRQVMGIYPLLADETCWLLAIDLDGETWPADVQALRRASAGLELAPAVERSRSGDGAHAWFFFASPVPASRARALGELLLTRAMARCFLAADGLL